MKKRALLSLLLALALLAGCAPAAEAPTPAPLPTAAASPTPAPDPTPSPTPEPPGHGDPADFYQFLSEMSAARKEIADQSEPLKMPAEYTPDFYEQNHTYTEEEMDVLTTQHSPKANLTKEDLISDTDTFFTLLQTTYGAYHYFGGDDTFFPIRDAVKEELAAMEAPAVQDLENVLYRRLSPVLVDNHFTIGGHGFWMVDALSMYYVPDLYLDNIEGVENPDYLKPTIGPDGRICYWYAAMSRDGGDLPSTLDGRALTWTQAGQTLRNNSALVFEESEWAGIPILISRRMSSPSNDLVNQQALERLASCGGEYADNPLLIFDVRGNGGGSDRCIRNWFRDWTRMEGQSRQTVAYRYSQFYFRLYGIDSAEGMGTYHIFSSAGKWAERSGPAFILQDSWVASSGETVVELFHTAADTIFVGEPTRGMLLVWNNKEFFLPHSGLFCYFGTGLGFFQAIENRDKIGYSPDLWVESTKALDAVERLIEYYGLNTAQ